MFARVSAPLLAVQQAKVAWAKRAARAGPAASPAHLRAHELALQRQQEAAAFARAEPHTGIDELELGAGWATGGPALLLGGAMHDERLGDQRRFGFPHTRR